ncbi:MAG: SDR family NAD(P)-dependent oxidoreductase [Synechococcales cyanobacterium RU_4_20]|nr:SDR family NAD(P)-dependent oxidoreductase [Synechococcales cyanobacterium RU_4_20]
MKILLHSPDEDQIALRSQPFVARLQPLHCPALPASTAKFSLKPQASYLVTGGLGALGLILAEWLADQGARHLVLVSRRSPNPQQQQTLAALAERGVNCDVRSLDVTDADAVAALCAELRQSPTPLAGLIHAAGSLADGLLLGQTWEQWQRVLAPKLLGSWNLHQATQADPLDFFVLFSSVASLLGSPGQGNYAAANAFLDAIAQTRRAQGQTALSLNWGPWAGAGMAEAVRPNRRLRQGLPLLDPAHCLEQLSQLLSDPVNDPAHDPDTFQLGLFQADWPLLLQQFPQFKTSGYFQRSPQHLRQLRQQILPQSFWQQRLLQQRLLQLNLQPKSPFENSCSMPVQNSDRPSWRTICGMRSPISSKSTRPPWLLVEVC